MKYLISTTEIHRFSSEADATEFIEAAKKESGYILSKSTVEYKEKKQKGEVVDYWWKVTLVKKFNDEREPLEDVEIEYKQGSAF